MSKESGLSSYSRNDEVRGDYMVYEVRYADGCKEYVSRSVFRRLEALEIIREKNINVGMFKSCYRIHSYQDYKESWRSWHGCGLRNLLLIDKLLTPYEFDLVKEALK